MYVKIDSASRSAWIGRAACKGMDINLFFPEEGASVSAEAREACAKCPVVEQCLDWAIKHEQHGFFGAMSPQQRQRERSVRRIALYAPQMNVPSMMPYGYFHRP
jgi:WhiB family redox-sensing transcriptional regulator